VQQILQRRLVQLRFRQQALELGVLLLELLVSRRASDTVIPAYLALLFSDNYLERRIASPENVTPEKLSSVGPSTTLFPPRWAALVLESDAQRLLHLRRRTGPAFTCRAIA
jgi:hypothetical protein